MSLPNLDEFLFLSVLAFPNASRMGLVCKMALSTPPPVDFVDFWVSCLSTNLVFSVFPEPDSPLITTLWLLPVSKRSP